MGPHILKCTPQGHGLLGIALRKPGFQKRLCRLSP